jgi:hypothetical protein
VVGEDEYEEMMVYMNVGIIDSYIACPRTNAR